MSKASAYREWLDLCGLSDSLLLATCWRAAYTAGREAMRLEAVKACRGLYGVCRTTADEAAAAILSLPRAADCGGDETGRGDA